MSNRIEPAGQAAIDAAADDEHRRRVRRALGACEHCGRGIDRSRGPELVPYHTLQRYARGEAISPPALAALDVWLEEQER
jgi:hypothetical protein